MNVTLKPMSERTFEMWLAASIGRQAEDRAWASGRPVSEERADLLDLLPRLLPNGRQTAGHAFLTAIDPTSGDAVGWLWIGPLFGQRPSAERFLFDVFIPPEYRRRGYGRGMLEAAFGYLAQQGVTAVVLNVRADNDPALALYDRLGFRPEDNGSGHWKTLRRPLSTITHSS